MHYVADHRSHLLQALPGVTTLAPSPPVGRSPSRISARARRALTRLVGEISPDPGSMESTVSRRTCALLTEISSPIPMMIRY